jgi:hypothetical protein
MVTKRHLCEVLLKHNFSELLIQQHILTMGSIDPLADSTGGIPPSYQNEMAQNVFSNAVSEEFDFRS